MHLDSRERVDLIFLQQSKRFNDLDSGTKDVMKAIVDTRTDIQNILTMSKEPTGGQHGTCIQNSLYFVDFTEIVF
jgi:hypothetical protein